MQYAPPSDGAPAPAAAAAAPRLAARRRFFDLLCRSSSPEDADTTATAAHLSRLADQVDAALLEKPDRMSTIAMALSDNVELCRQLVARRIAPAELVLMTDTELMPRELVAAGEKALAEENARKQLDWNRMNRPKLTGPVLEQYRCRRCRSADVDVTQRQMRSADEPMSEFCHCNGCGSRWRIN
jgi:DNA-directed RNA polymerase subunit M/transcription elongation factor TFIIS